MSDRADQLYTFALIDEDAKREIRRSLLKAVAIPGHMIPFASRDLPIARGWGTGGLQITMAIITPADTLKVIDQGDVDVSFQLEAGEVLGIVGESGSGKSTLLRMLNLALRPDSGHLWYYEDGKQPCDLLTLNRYEMRLFRNNRMGIVHQRPELGLNMRFSVGGNVAEKLLLAEWRHFGRIRERTAELMIKAVSQRLRLC